MADDTAKALERNSSHSGFRVRSEIGAALRFRGREIPILKPRIVLGRHIQCDIVLASDLVSRQHAQLSIRGRTLVVEDLGSRNGTLVNSELIRAPTVVAPGDIIIIGEERLEVVEAEERHVSQPTVKFQRVRLDAVASAKAAEAVPKLPSFEEELGEDPHEATSQADVFELLMGLVDKALALGQGPEAERLISGHLATALEHASAGVRLEPALTERCARYAVRLAIGTSKAAWVDYAFRLYRAQKLALPLDVVDQLYEVVRRLSGIDLHLIRDYLSVLQSRPEPLNPTERFVLQRISGLLVLAR